VKSPRPSNLLAARVIVQPYGFWHRPLVRAGAMAVGLMLGVAISRCRSAFAMTVA